MNCLYNTITEKAKKIGIEIYMVGGATRDRLLRRDITDIDFACSKGCHILAQAIADELKGSYVNMHEDVARIILRDIGVDISNFKGKTIYEDLSKRDFTINSIAMDVESGKLIDPFKGQEDLKNGIIRSTYQGSFYDDPLRMIRAVRFSSQLGFKIHKNTGDLIIKNAFLIDDIPGERILDEIYKIFQCKNSNKYLKLLNDLKLMDSIFPIMKKMKKIGQCKYHVVDAYTHSILSLKCFEEGIDSVYAWEAGDMIREHLLEDVNGKERLSILKLGIFLHDIGKPEAMHTVNGQITFKGHDILGEAEFNKISKRLVVPLKQRNTILSIIKGHMRILGLYKNKMSNRALYRLYRDFGDNTVDVLLSSLFDITATRSLLKENGETSAYWKFIKEAVKRYYEFINKKKVLITGKDVIDIKGVSGKEIGDILDILDEEIFIGRINTREEALKFIENI